MKKLLLLVELDIPDNSHDSEVIEHVFTRLVDPDSAYKVTVVSLAVSKRFETKLKQKPSNKDL